MQRIVTVLLLVLLTGLHYRLWVADGGVAHTYRLRGEVRAQYELNAERAARNAALDAEIRDLKSGVAAIESRARATLGMVRGGETFYLVVNPS
jgi:cell division protein FtsB